MLTIQPISPSDVEMLLPICKKTFHDAFYHLSKPADFDAYASKAFTTEKLLSEINNPNSLFYFAMIDGTPAGYLKLNFKHAQSEAQDENAMEIERLYILDVYQGQKIGQQLMDFALQIAVEKQIKYVWLCVWEKNPDAIRFYEKNGFRIFGKHTFEYGVETDEDWLMRNDL
jgi:ribosomal protein S18 acetylase RimI-like enzyme